MPLRPNQRCFNTKEAAERHLEFRRKAAYKRIEKKGWKVVGDNSFVHQNDFFYCPHLPSTHKNKGKWFVCLAIVTDELIRDLEKMTTMSEIQDAESRLIQELQSTISKETIKGIIKKAK